MQSLRHTKIPVTLKVILTLAFIVAGIYYIWLRRVEFTALEWPSWKAIAIISAAFVANIYLMSLFNALVARQLGANISMLESFALSIVTSAANFVLPLRAGAGFRGIYMKKAYGLSYASFASTIAVFYVCNVFVASLLGLAAVTVIYVQRGYLAFDMLMIFLLITLGSTLLIIRSRRSDAENVHDAPWWLRLYNSYQNILRQKDIALYVLSLVCLSFAISTVAWHFALQEYIAGISIPDSFLVVASQVLGALIPLTPGGTGIQELVGIYFGYRLKITIVSLFAVLVWTKLLRILISVGATAPTLFYLQRKLARLQKDR